MEENVFEKKLYNILEQNISIPKSITNSILTFDCKKKTGRNMQSLKKIAVAFSFLVISSVSFEIADIFSDVIFICISSEISSTIGVSSSKDRTLSPLASV